MSYNVNWVPNKLQERIKIRETEGTLHIFDSEPGKLISRIAVKDVNAPELPSMVVLDNTGWVYYETKWEAGLTVYVFHVDEADAHMLDMMVLYFDTLYG